MSRERRSRKISGKWIFIAAAVLVLGGLALFVMSAKEEAEQDKLMTFECNAERVEFLNSCGLIVEPDPESKTVTIPAEFSDSYKEYNELQKSQGFDLTPYAGREVTLYTYKILNYPDHSEGMAANLLFDDHLLIGADITFNDAENGFTKPLRSAPAGISRQ